GCPTVPPLRPRRTLAPGGGRVPRIPGPSEAARRGSVPGAVLVAASGITRAPSFPAPSELLRVYLFLLSFGIATVVGVAASYAGFGWFWTPVVWFLAFAATWIVGVRRIGRRVAPVFEQAQRQVAAGMVQPAIASLKTLLPLGKWMPLLTGQLHAQLGFLEHQANNRARAIEHLSQAGRRSGDARLLLAGLHAQDGKKTEAMKLLAESLPFNRKHVLLHNTYAWLLN